MFVEGDFCLIYHVLVLYIDCYPDKGLLVFAAFSNSAYPLLHLYAFLDV